MARFSIIIPVYNVEQYLDACVTSVLNQEFSDFEVLLVDDGATDSSGAICDAWAKKDNRIRVIHQENQGASVARNTGIKEATGDYLMFLDSDDWWEDQQVLSCIAKRLEKIPADVLSFNFRKMFGTVSKTPYFKNTADAPDNPDDSMKWIMSNSIWISSPCNKVVRSTLFAENNLLFHPGIVSEDIDWNLRLALCAQRFDFIKKVVFVYRQRTDSLSHRIPQSRVNGLCTNVEECLRLLSTADAEKSGLLRPFVAYQYATLLYNYANIKKKQRSYDLSVRIKQMRYLLEWSESIKVRLIRKADQLLGFEGMLLALRCHQWLLRGR